MITAGLRVCLPAHRTEGWPEAFGEACEPSPEYPGSLGVYLDRLYAEGPDDDLLREVSRRDVLVCVPLGTEKPGWFIGDSPDVVYDDLEAALTAFRRRQTLERLRAAAEIGAARQTTTTVDEFHDAVEGIVERLDLFANGIVSIQMGGLDENQAHWELRRLCADYLGLKHENGVLL